MSKTVILIDDDQDDLDLMKEAIGELDGSITTLSFHEPDKALRVITQELILLPQHVFIDINMPILSGDKILKALRGIREFDSVKITMLSTSMSMADAGKFKREGANFTFQKPLVYDHYHGILKVIFVE
jgi:CheY-like chemotaxis protein